MQTPRREVQRIDSSLLCKFEEKSFSSRRHSSHHIYDISACCLQKARARATSYPANSINRTIILCTQWETKHRSLPCLMLTQLEKKFQTITCGGGSTSRNVESCKNIQKRLDQQFKLRTKAPRRSTPRITFPSRCRKFRMQKLGIGALVLCMAVSWKRSVPSHTLLAF